jgi:hypothetical protein
VLRASIPKARRRAWSLVRLLDRLSETMPAVRGVADEEGEHIGIF